MGVREDPELVFDLDRNTHLLSAILVFAAQDWLAAIFGFALWFLSLKGLRLMAKADPYMRAVYLRQRGYQAYYPARSTPFRNNKGGYL
jgi:type IV secretion system protein VirB3